MRSPCSAVLLALAASLALAAEPPGAAPKPLFPDVKPLRVESLDAPIKTLPYKENTWALNADGNGWTRILIYPGGQTATQIALFNTATGGVKVIDRPEFKGYPWRFCQGQDGKHYMGYYGSASLWIYDPLRNDIRIADGNIKDVGTVSAISWGTDGKINCSSTMKCISFDYDPATGVFRNFGIQGKVRNYMGYGYSVAGDADYIYTAAGKIPWQLVACHKATGKQKVLKEIDEGGSISVNQGRFGVTAVTRAREGDAKSETLQYWLYKGEAIPRKADSKAPWPEPADVKPLPNPPRPEELLDDAIPGGDGKATYWWRTAEDKAKAPKNPPEGADPKALGWKSVEYTLRVTDAVKLSFLREMEDGRILGTGPAYYNWFVLDPKTGKIDLHSKLPLSHYATVLGPNGKVYMMGYPNSMLWEYDPTRPWTVGTGEPGKPAPAENSPLSNPRRLFYYGHLIDTHHARAGAVGADGKINPAPHAHPPHVGGGLGWWDPKTQKPGGLREPFALYDVAGLCATDGARKIVYSSRIVKDPATGKKPGEAKLFVYDTEKKELTGSFAPFPGQPSTGGIVGGPGATIIGHISGETTLLYRADVVAQKVLQQVTVPAKLGREFRMGPDGRIWSFADNVLVRINPATLALDPVGTLEDPGRIAFAGKDIYLAGAPEVRVVRGILK